MSISIWIKHFQQIDVQLFLNWTCMIQLFLKEPTNRLVGNTTTEISQLLKYCMLKRRYVTTKVTW